MMVKSKRNVLAILIVAALAFLTIGFAKQNVKANADEEDGFSATLSSVKYNVSNDGEYTLLAAAITTENMNRIYEVGFYAYDGEEKVALAPVAATSKTTYYTAINDADSKTIFGTETALPMIVWKVATPNAAVSYEAYVKYGYINENDNNNLWSYATEKTVNSAKKAITVANYTVKHMQQNIADDNYTEVEGDREVKSGIAGAATLAAANSYTGFGAGSLSQGTIAADGSTIVEVEYDRLNYTVTWKNGEDTVREDSVRYGVATPAAPNVERTDKITTWYPASAATVTENAQYTVDYKSIQYAGEIWDFTDPAIVANDVKQSAGRNYYVDYLNNYDGESGVVAVTNTLNDWNWDVWFLQGYTAFAESVNENADTLYIRLKASAANVKMTLFGGGADAGASLVLYEYVIPTDWTTVAITGEKFTAFKTYLAHYRGACQAWMQNAGTVYISDIYVGKSETVTNNNSALVFGEVTINDDSATVFSGYTKLACEVKAPDNTLVTVTDGKFTPTDNGVYTVNYYALMPSGVVKTGSYTITCLEKNDLGTFVPSASDWHQQGGSSYTATVIDNYAEHITNVDTAAYTNFDTLRAYMTANSITTVKIRFDFIVGGKISIGKQNGGNTSFEFGDTDGSGRVFASGSYYVMEINLLDFERVYCQIIWQPCEFYVTYEFVA